MQNLFYSVENSPDKIPPADARKCENKSDDDVLRKPDGDIHERVNY